VTDIGGKMDGDIVDTSNKFSEKFLQDSFFLAGVVNAINKKRILTWRILEKIYISCFRGKVEAVPWKIRKY
jgi:hypothetical protein